MGQLIFLLIAMLLIPGCAKNPDGSYTIDGDSIVEAFNSKKFVVPRRNAAVNQEDKMTLEDFFLLIMQPDNISRQQGIERATRYANENVQVIMPEGNGHPELTFTLVPGRNDASDKLNGYLDFIDDEVWSINNMPTANFRNSFSKIQAKYAGSEIPNPDGASPHLNLYYILYAEGKKPALFFCQILGDNTEFGCRYWNLQPDLPKGVKPVKRDENYVHLFPESK